MYAGGREVGCEKHPLPNVQEPLRRPVLCLHAPYSAQSGWPLGVSASPPRTQLALLKKIVVPSLRRVSSGDERIKS